LRRVETCQGDDRPGKSRDVGGGAGHPERVLEHDLDESRQKEKPPASSRVVVARGSKIRETTVRGSAARLAA
jgi:hypothetical protein